MVNRLRVEAGIPALDVHPVLMQIAQTEANGIASGAGIVMMRSTYFAALATPSETATSMPASSANLLLPWLM